MTERLDRIEQTLATLAASQLATDARITSIADAVDLLVQVSGQQSQAITQLIESQNQTFAHMDAMQAEIREIQSDVRGLQTENRRILDILQNRTND